MNRDPYPQSKQAVDGIATCGEAFEKEASANYVIRQHAGETAGLAGINPDWERDGRVFELAFDRLDFQVVAITHAVENENSRRAIEKYVDRFGGQPEGPHPERPGR